MRGNRKMNVRKLSEANKKKIAGAMGVPILSLNLEDAVDKTILAFQELRDLQRKKLLALDRRGRDYIYGTVVIIPDRRA